MRIIFTYIIILFSTITTTLAQLTLDDYRKQVIDYSLSLKGATNSVVQSENQLSYTKTLLLPKLSASGSYRHYMHEYDGVEPWGVSLEPQIVQTIYGGGVLRAEVDKAELSYKASICNADFTHLEVCYAAEYAYWNYWAMNRYYLVMKEYVDIIEKQLSKIEYKYNEGALAKGDLLMIKAQLSDAEHKLISANKRRVEALYNLNIMRGSAPSNSVSLLHPSLDNYPTPLRVSFDNVIQQRSDYNAMLLKEQIAHTETQSVKGSYNPTLQGGVAGGLRSLTPNIEGDIIVDGSIFVSLSVPIYRFGERRKAVAVSANNEVQALLNSSMLYDQIVKEESDAWLSVVDSKSQVGIATKSLDIASENLDISTFSYNEGLVSILELMQAQISWIQIYTNAITSEYNYLVALAYYKKASGGQPY